MIQLFSLAVASGHALTSQVIAVFCLMVVYVFALTLKQITLIAAWLDPMGHLVDG